MRDMKETKLTFEQGQRLAAVQLLSGAVVQGKQGLPAVSRLTRKDADLLELVGHTIRFRARGRKEIVTIPLSAVVYYIFENEAG